MTTVQSTDEMMVRTYAGATAMEADAASLQDLAEVRQEGYEVHSRVYSGNEVTVTYRHRGKGWRWQAILSGKLVAAVLASLALSAFVLAAIITLLGWWEDISATAYANLVVLLGIALWLALANAIANATDHAQVVDGDEAKPLIERNRRVVSALTVAFGVAIIVAAVVTAAWLVGGYQFADTPSEPLWNLQFGAMTAAAAWSLVYALWLFRDATQAELDRLMGSSPTELGA